MFKKFKSQKGAALEIAIVTILTLYALCFILYVVSFKDRIRNKYENYTFDQPTTVESIGEYFLLYCKNDNGMDFAYNINGFHTDVADNENSLKLTVFDQNENNEIVLVVEVEKSTNKILRWYFNNKVNNSSNKLFDAQ